MNIKNPIVIVKEMPVKKRIIFGVGAFILLVIGVIAFLIHDEEYEYFDDEEERASCLCNSKNKCHQNKE